MSTEDFPLLPLRLCLRERPLEIVSLPVEVLAHIFTHLDFPSVRALRLTSKTFYSVTETRQFWYCHLNKLVEAHHLAPPEDELDSYTVDELANWTLRRSRALDVSLNSEQPRFRKRTLDLRPRGLADLPSRNFKLIPGGRWLLISHPSAVMYFLDLDSLNPVPRLLFNSKEMGDQIHELTRVSFGIWIDRGAPRLSFRLAFVVETEDMARTYISQVDLASHGVDATLVASNIAMFRNFNLNKWYVGVTLNDHYLVQVWSGNTMNTGIGISDYRLARGHPDYPVNHGGDPSTDVINPSMMEFICDDIFAVHCMVSHTLSIFAIEPSSSLKLLYRIHMDSYQWSTPRWTPGATLATMIETDTQEIQGLVIPHNPSLPPSITTLGRCSNSKTCLYTLGTWVLVCHQNLYTVLSHNWDFGSPTDPPPTLTYRFEKFFSTNLLMFDEDTARFLGYPCERYLVIYDIV